MTRLTLYRVAGLLQRLVRRVSVASDLPASGISDLLKLLKSNALCLTPEFRARMSPNTFLNLVGCRGP